MSNLLDPKIHVNIPGWGISIHYQYDGHTIILTKEEFDRRINEAFNAGFREGQRDEAFNAGFREGQRVAELP